MQKLLGIALLIGGTLVGMILLWLMNIYVNEGKLSTTIAIISLLVGFVFLVLPQWGIGIYVLKANPSNRNEP